MFEKSGIKDAFSRFVDTFYQNKSNQLSFSNSTLPNRVIKVTIDLSVVRGETNPFPLNFPFNSLHVEKFYTANGTIVPTASCKLLFDYGNINNIQNALLLQNNDSFTLSSEVSKAYIVNTNQGAVFVDISFFVDIDFKAGSSQSNITGTVNSVTNGYSHVINTGQSGNAGKGTARIIVGTTIITAPFSISLNTNRAGVFLKHMGGATNAGAPAGFVNVSSDISGGDPFSAANTYSNTVPSAIALLPGDSIWLPITDTITISMPDFNTLYGYTPTDAIISYHEVLLS